MLARRASLAACSRSASSLFPVSDASASASALVTLLHQRALSGRTHVNIPGYGTRTTASVLGDPDLDATAHEKERREREEQERERARMAEEEEEEGPFLERLWRNMKEKWMVYMVFIFGGSSLSTSFRLWSEKKAWQASLEAANAALREAEDKAERRDGQRQRVLEALEEFERQHLASARTQAVSRTESEELIDKLREELGAPVPPRGNQQGLAKISIM